MSGFIKNSTEEVLFSTSYLNSRGIAFYKNQSSHYLNCVASSGTVGASLIITSQRIVYDVGKFVNVFNTEWAKSLGMCGFEIKKEEITNSFLRKAILPIFQEYVFETKRIVFSIPVGYFWDDKIKNAIKQFLIK